MSAEAGPTAPSSAPATAEGILRRLEWRVIRRLDGLLQGDYRTLFHGVGIDLADLRDYQPGDDVRHIDWNVTARMDSPYVRTFLEDREMTAWLLLDRSPSMGFGPLGRRSHGRPRSEPGAATAHQRRIRRGLLLGRLPGVQRCDGPAGAWLLIR